MHLAVFILRMKQDSSNCYQNLTSRVICAALDCLYCSLYFRVFVQYLLFLHTGCGTGTVCPTAQSPAAYCNRCDFNRAAQQCGSFDIRSERGSGDSSTLTDSSLCLSGPITVYVGSSLEFTGLIPPLSAQCLVQLFAVSYQRALVI